MEPVPIRIVGISASAIKSGNCDKVMEEALKTAESFDHVQTEFITLAEKDIMTCKHCQWCIEQRKPCKYKDDSTWILKEMAEADGMIAAMDVISGQFKDGSVFIPEVLLSARAMNDGLKVLEPHLASTTRFSAKVLIGTVHGDMHDIGNR